MCLSGFFGGWCFGGLGFFQGFVCLFWVFFPLCKRANRHTNEIKTLLVE